MFCELRGRLRTNRSSTCAILPPFRGPAMDETLKAQIPYTLREADFPRLGQLYRGKVRDNYSNGERIVMITTDRLSAFDRVLTTVPFKGELLNRLTTFWFAKTKDEFGLDKAGKLWVIDEIHTADSSRYWIAEGSERRVERGEDQKMLDKEFFRQWLIRERNYKGEGSLPQIPDEVRAELAGKYVELVATLTGSAPKLSVGDTRARIEKALKTGKYL